MGSREFLFLLITGDSPLELRERRFGFGTDILFPGLFEFLTFFGDTIFVPLCGSCRDGCQEDRADGWVEGTSLAGRLLDSVPV
jgi:hypothetical protein